MSDKFTPQNKILCVNGSPRKGGNTDIMLAHLVDSLPGLVPANTVMLRGLDFSACTGCERCRKDRSCTGITDGMNAVYPEVTGSLGLVLASPVHNYNVTALMKAFIDRLYCYYEFSSQRPGPWSSRLAGQNRKAAIIAVCEQRDRKDMGFTLEAMRMPLEALGYEVIEELAVFGIFSRGAVRKDSHAMHRIEEIAHSMAGSVT